MRAVLMTAGPALLLGIVIRALLLLVTALFDPAHAGEGIGSELASRVSWSLIVCVALGIGLAMAKRRARAMALAGLVAAPVAFQVARGVRRGIVGALHLLDLSGQPSPVTLGLIKGIEYACLGLLLAWLVARSLRLAIFALAGLIVGTAFGLITLLVTASASAAPLTMARLLTWAVNEIVFPVGCALVVRFAADRGLAIGSRPEIAPGGSAALA